MGRHEDKSKAAGVYRTGGKEYVTISEASRRLGKSRRTIAVKVQDGRLTEYHFEEKGVSGKWLLWTQVKSLFAAIDARRKQYEGNKSQNDFEMKPLGVLDNGELAPVAVRGLPPLVDVDDPENSDCWKTTNNGVPILDGNGRHIISYDKYKQKYDALIRRQQFEREKGRLIPRELVDRAFASLLTPLVSSVMQIPDRYASRVFGLVEGFAETKLDNMQQTSIRALLEDEAENIVAAFRRNLEEALDGLESD